MNNFGSTTMSTPAGKPLTIDVAPSDLSRYLIDSRAGVVAILDTLQKAGSQVTAYFGGGNNFVLTSVIAVRPDQDELIVDYGADPASNKRAVQAKRISFVGMHERIKMQFYTSSLRHVLFEGRDAFSTPLPTALLRLQRREYYRIATPLNKPLTCVIPSQPTPKGVPVEMSIVDISCGGIAMVRPKEPAVIEPGVLFRSCGIRLPEVGVIPANLLVKSTFETTRRNGFKQLQAGCEFVDMSERERAKIQRYINMLERERKERAGER